MGRTLRQGIIKFEKLKDQRPFFYSSLFSSLYTNIQVLMYSGVRKRFFTFLKKHIFSYSQQWIYKTQS